MDTLGKDLVLAARRLRRSPAFTAVALATLGLGIGANVAMFSLLDAVVLRPLPVPDPDRLVRVWPAQNLNKTLVDELSREATTLDPVSGLSYWSLSLVGEEGGEPEQLSAAAVDVDFFEALGVRALEGRTFVAEEADPSMSGVVVLGHGFWQRRYGGDRSIIGRTIALDGVEHASRRVIGVLPPRFPTLWQEVDAYVPLDRPGVASLTEDGTWYVNWVVARLAPGATVASASAEVAALAHRLKSDHPGLFSDANVAVAGVQPLRENLTGSARRAAWLLVGAVGLILLIGCVNLANLLLARAGAAEGELAVRKALGASRGRLVRQGLTESLLLATLGGLVGIALATWLLALLGPELAARLPRVGDVAVNPKVLVFAVVVSAAAAVLFGLLPAVRSARRAAIEGLRGAGRSGTGTRSSHRLNRGLVAGEVAMAVMLVSAAALAANSFWRLHRVDPGFEAASVVALELAPAPTRYAGAEAQRALYRGVIERLEAVPGVESVGAIHLLPLTASNWRFPYLADGFEPRADQPLPAANFRVVTPDYFDVMRIPLRQGRGLSPTDVAGGERVMVVNEAFVRQRWPEGDAVDRVVRVFGNQPFRVVGVVGDVRQHTLDGPPEPEMYVAHEQWALSSMVVMVRTEPAAEAKELVPALRAAAWDVDDQVPIPRARPMTEVLGESVAEARLLAGLLTGFGALALLLGAVGVYGVMTYTTTARTREFAIRLALGAAPAAIRRAALRVGLLPVGIGIAVGVAGTLAAGRLLSGLLFGIEPQDPATLLAVVATLTAVAGLATWLPARRAGAVEPGGVLKGE